MKPSSLVGQVMNGVYRLTRPIASGGGGEIYEAEHLRQHGRHYAVKILQTPHNPVAMQRFQREATITSELGHDHIVEVYEFAVAESGAPYMVMELLEGEDLAQRLARTGPMALDDVLRIVRQVALGLEAAHREGVVHRDLKPHNIFLCRRPDGDELVKLLDFGVSKVHEPQKPITGDNMLTGTPSYMSPEQAESRLGEIDHRTDIFALGAVVWEMLTGKRAFEAPTIAGTLYQVVFTAVDPVRYTRPELPARVDVVLRTAMAKQKRLRYSSAMLFAAQLADAAAQATPVIARSSAEIRAQRTTGPDLAIGTSGGTLDTPALARPKRVMFVDDSPTMCKLGAGWLSGDGYDVVTAEDGEDALAKIRVQPPDLVIADVNMPRRNGFALCRAIKDDPATQHIPVILFTRLNDASDVVHGLAAGADAFVPKGSGAADLLRQVESLLPDSPDPQRRKSTAVASMQDRFGTMVGRKAIFKRLFHALFREVPFDILAVLVECSDRRHILLLGSHHELPEVLAAQLAENLLGRHGLLTGQQLTAADVDVQPIVIDPTGTWGDAALELQRSVTVPILLDDAVIGSLGVFSFEDHPALDANVRFFFDIGVAAAHAIRRRER